MRSHVNSLGARKYTDFLEKYLSANYDLPDHRGDENYDEWQALANNYVSIANDSQAAVQGLIDSANGAFKVAEDIKTEEDFSAWAALVNDERFTVIAVGKCGFLARDLRPQYTSSLKQLNLYDIYGKDNYIKIIRGADVVGANADESSSVTVNIGHNQYPVPCVIDNDLMAAIYIDGTNYSLGNNSNINMVVFDNYHRTVVDSVYLYVEDGSIKIGRK